MPSNRRYATIAELPGEIPLFPLEGALLLPHGALPLNIFEPRYLALIDETLASNRLIGMIQPLPDQEAAERPALFDVGCLGRVTQFSETGDGRYRITLTGICRFRLSGLVDRASPYPWARADYASFTDDLSPETDDSAVDRTALLATLRKYAEKNNYAVDWDSVNKAPTIALVDALAMASPFGVREKQALLEAVEPSARAEVLVAIAEVEMAGDVPGGGRGLQ